MTIERLRTALRAQPFRPFALHLADGREFVAEHPGFCAIFPGMERTAVFAFPEQDELEIIDLLLVTSMPIGATTRKKRRKAG